MAHGIHLASKVTHCLLKFGEVWVSWRLIQALEPHHDIDSLRVWESAASVAGQGLSLGSCSEEIFLGQSEVLHDVVHNHVALALLFRVQDGVFVVLDELGELCVADAEELGVEFVDLGRAILDAQLVVDLLSPRSILLLGSVVALNSAVSCCLVDLALANIKALEYTIKGKFLR